MCTACSRVLDQEVNDFSQPVDRYLDLAEATAGSVFAFLFDTAKNLALWDCPEAVLVLVRNRVVAVHLADIEWPGAFKPVVPGKGTSPHASILKALQGDGFDGWISAEEASRYGLDGLAAGFGHADAVWQSVGGACHSRCLGRITKGLNSVLEGREPARPTFETGSGSPISWNHFRALRSGVPKLRANCPAVKSACSGLAGSGCWNLSG